MENVITVFTDGGARGNGNEDAVGGWGVVLRYKGHEKELWGGEKGVTNNQMELKGAINALQNIKTTNIPIRLHSDSAYVVNGITKWVAGWKKKGWRKGDGKTPENLDLWKQLDNLVHKQDDIQFIWVKGHATNEGNNRADELANIAMNELEE